MASYYDVSGSVYHQGKTALVRCKITIVYLYNAGGISPKERLLIDGKDKRYCLLYTMNVRKSRATGHSRKPHLCQQGQLSLKESSSRKSIWNSVSVLQLIIIILNWTIKSSHVDNSDSSFYFVVICMSNWPVQLRFPENNSLCDTRVKLQFLKRYRSWWKLFNIIDNLKQLLSGRMSN